MNRVNSCSVINQEDSTIHIAVDISTITIRQHHYARHKMRPIVTDVSWLVCLSCLLVTTVSHTKTVKQTEMPFGQCIQIKWARGTTY